MFCVVFIKLVDYMNTFISAGAWIGLQTPDKVLHFGIQTHILAMLMAVLPSKVGCCVSRWFIILNIMTTQAATVTKGMHKVLDALKVSHFDTFV
jgi:hypothetical protein